MNKSKTFSPQTGEAYFMERLKRLQKELGPLDCDGIIIENCIDLFYLTGMELSAGQVISSKNNSSLFVDGRYLQVAEENASLPVFPMGEEELTTFLLKKKIARLGFDAEHSTYRRFQKLRRFLTRARRKEGVGTKLIPCSHLLQPLRVIKDPIELKIMKKSAKLAWECYEYVRKIAREGVSEKEIADRLEIYCRKIGAEALSFDPVIAFGTNTSKPHHHCSNKKLKKGDAVLVDLGVRWKKYCSDMTRVFFFGKENPKISRLYSVVKEAQRAALRIARPGTLIKELDLAARKVMKREGVEDLFTHSLGHGVGLEIHEYPSIHHKCESKNLALQEGMVITIEPGLYLPGTGGVRYEDTIAITKNGYTNFYPE